MLGKVLAYIHNWFDVDDMGNSYEHWSGEFTVADGAIELPLYDGQYFRIVGSHLNDGVYTYPVEELKDETFNGAVYELRIPKELLGIVKEIEEWQEKNGAIADSPFNSESFGGYSYNKGSTASDELSGLSGWQKAFNSRLEPWRKL